MSEWIVELGDGNPHIKKMIPVIRCKYCMLFETGGDGDWGWCNNWDHKTSENGFCHDAKKKVTE